MPYLRFNTDEGRRVAGLLRRVTEILSSESTALMTNVDDLVGSSWQADGAYLYRESMVAWQASVQSAVEHLIAIETRLQSEMVEWEETAAVFAGGAAGAMAGEAFFEPVEEPVQTGPLPMPSPFEPVPIPKEVETTTKWLADKGITGTVVQSYSNTRGETVATDGPEDKFWRHSYEKKYRSNCTWYAAAAVSAASGGRLSVPAWGNGSEWVKAAKDDTSGLVSGVDKKPKAGDVYANNKFHVAFVEEVRTSADGEKVYVVVSEENAGQEGGQGAGEPVNPKESERLSINDDAGAVSGAKEIRRFRRVITFENVGSSEEPAIRDTPDFIHFNYNYSNE